jgi:nucleoid-associated protein YejK
MSKTLELMYQYQKNNNIVRKCLTNTQFLRDSIVFSGKKAMVRAVFAQYTFDRTLYLVVHLVVETNGIIIDPSHEIAQHKPTYYDKIHQLPKLSSTIEIAGLSRKDMIKHFLSFSSHADEINNGVCIVNDLEYYHGQADFVNGNTDDFRGQSSARNKKLVS